MINILTQFIMDFTANHFTPIIVALITGILSPLCLQIFQNLQNKKNEKKKQSLNKQHTIENEELIISKLETIKEKFKCDRAWIAEFHNGTKTYSGKSFQKFSITYEVVSQGIATEAINTQSIPTSIFSPFFKKLIEDYYCHITDINNIEDPISVSMKSFWETRGISSFIAVSIKDIRNNFVGFLCLDGVINDLNISSEDIQKLIVHASNFAGYLETGA
jgi:hypothetical protein